MVSFPGSCGQSPQRGELFLFSSESWKIHGDELFQVRDSLAGGGSSFVCHWQGCKFSHKSFTDHRRHLNIHCYQVSSFSNPMNDNDSP